MRTLGLIGGMSFESSAIYYRLINEGVRRRLGALHSAEMVLHSVDFQPIAELQRAERWKDAGAKLAQAAKGLEAAGAECVLICANTMHLVADAVESAVRIPVIHIIDETAKRLKDAGCRRPLLLATRYTMEHGFYTGRMERQGIDVLVPAAEDRVTLHAIIYEELCVGKILNGSRTTLMGMIERAKDAGADSVIFGCTEIGLILDPTELPLPGFDTALIHCEAAVDFALSGQQ